MQLFAGLGNPGAKHRNNRHNIGFMALEEIARRHTFGPWRGRFQGLASEGLIGGERILALKPMTYMNESGRSIGEAARFFKLPSQSVTVFYDELDLAPGRMRLKRGGGAGGHNGIRDIDRHIDKNYRRVRLGIGHPGHKDRVQGYVLSDIPGTDRMTWCAALLDALARHADDLVAARESRYMSRVAQSVFPPPPKPARAPREQSPETETPGDGV